MWVEEVISFLLRLRQQLPCGLCHPRSSVSAEVLPLKTWGVFLTVGVARLCAPLSYHTLASGVIRRTVLCVSVFSLLVFPVRRSNALSVSVRSQRNQRHVFRIVEYLVLFAQLDRWRGVRVDDALHVRVAVEDVQPADAPQCAALAVRRLPDRDNAGLRRRDRR